MTELQKALLLAALVVVGWVVFVNFRERRRASKALDKKPASLFEEPVVRISSERNPTLDTPSEISEAIAVLRWQDSVLTSRVENETRGLRRVGSKPLLYGWLDIGASSPTAEPSGQRISELHVGVLLATRAGPLHAMEYTEWQEVLNKLAAALGAQCQIPDMTEVLAKARALDQQCAAVDAQLSLVVRADHVLSVDAIAAAAQVAGLEQRGESRFAMGSLHQQQFSVFPGDTGDTLVLLLDVPRTQQPRQAFEEMARVGEVLANALSAQLVDESGRRLEKKDFELIADQVSVKEQQLYQMGIEPGSAIALRLFL